MKGHSVASTRSLEERELRAAPDWAWFVACLFYPAGLFIMLSKVRLLKWRTGLIAAVLSYGALAVSVACMAYFQYRSKQAEHLCLIISVVVFVAIGMVQYRIGKSRNYWSRRCVRVWRIFWWLLVAMFTLNVVVHALLYYVWMVGK